MVSSVSLPEDSVVGHQRDTEPDGRRRDPPVGVMVPLSQNVPAALAAHPGVDLRLHEVVVRPHHLGAGDVEREALKAVLAPSPKACSVAGFGHRLE